MIREYLESLNYLMKLTHRELDVLSIIVNHTFDVLHGECRPISPVELRKTIMANTQINKNNLSKYMSTFIDKNIIKYGEIDRTIIVNDYIIPRIDGNEIDVMFKLIVK